MNTLLYLLLWIMIDTHGCASECPEACDNTYYSVASSSTVLDFHNISKIIPPAEIEHIEEEQAHAVNTRSRLSVDQFYLPAQALEDLIDIQVIT